MAVSWKPTTLVKKSLHFSDLDATETFKIARGKAVYEKVYVPGHNEYTKSPKPIFYMLELETGKLFTPTNSVVERVEVETKVNLPKPNIYT